LSGYSFWVVLATSMFTRQPVCSAVSLNGGPADEPGLIYSVLSPAQSSRGAIQRLGWHRPSVYTLFTRDDALKISAISKRSGQGSSWF